MKTLIISSSLSPNSRSFLLCKAVEEFLKEGNIEVEVVDLRKYTLHATHLPPSPDVEVLKKKVAEADNYIFWMWVHCYSFNDNLKIFLDTVMGECDVKLFAVLCAAWGHHAYLATMHLTQVCMNERRMIQLPRVVYAAGGDFSEENKINENIFSRCKKLSEEFVELWEKLL